MFYVIVIRNTEFSVVGGFSKAEDALQWGTDNANGDPRWQIVFLRSGPPVEIARTPTDAANYYALHASLPVVHAVDDGQNSIDQTGNTHQKPIPPKPVPGQPVILNTAPTATPATPAPTKQ